MTTDTCTAPSHSIALNEPPMVRRMLLKHLAFMEPARRINWRGQR